jgi:hypothetical protein
MKMKPLNLSKESPARINVTQIDPVQHAQDAWSAAQVETRQNASDPAQSARQAWAATNPIEAARQAWSVTADSFRSASDAVPSTSGVNIWARRSPTPSVSSESSTVDVHDRFNMTASGTAWPTTPAGSPSLGKGKSVRGRNLMKNPGKNNGFKKVSFYVSKQTLPLFIMGRNVP